MHTLKPALVLGSGFHRYVLGNDTERNPICSWHSLIDAVSERLDVRRPPPAMPPTLRWETMINAAVRDGFQNRHGQRLATKDKKPSQVEAEARRIVSIVLGETEENYPAGQKSNLPADSRWGCVISLNFDVAWLVSAGLDSSLGPLNAPPSKALTKAEQDRLGRSVEPLAGKHARVCFPNGTTLAPNTIRMGLHDYGNAPAGMQHGFSRLKMWESALVGISGARSRTAFQPLASALQAASCGAFDTLDIPMTWVAEFLYRPLVFFGVGLSEQEIGLWWLLAQRRRNLARVSESPGVSAQILLRSGDRADFWNERPFGVQPIWCTDWESGVADLLSRYEP